MAATEALAGPAANALPDDPGWCGHPLVDRSRWRCADCDRPVTDATRHRLETAPTPAPPGCVWVLTEGPGADYGADYPGGAVVGVFSDRARIGRLLVRQGYIGAAGLRDVLAQLTWYQSVYNPDAIEGWGVDGDGNETNFRLDVERVDRPGSGAAR